MSKCSKCGIETKNPGYCKGCKREYNQRPEVKERQRKYQREYYQRPGVKERQRKYQREYYQRPGVKERQREYDKHPPNAEKRIYEAAKAIGLSEECAKAYAFDGMYLKPFKMGGKVQDGP